MPGKVWRHMLISNSALSLVCCSKDNDLDITKFCDLYFMLNLLKLSETFMSNSLWPHGLHVACQVPLSMGFPRQEYCNGCYSLLQGSSLLRVWTRVSSIGRFFTTEPSGKPITLTILSLLKSIIPSVLGTLYSSYSPPISPTLFS